MFNHNCLCLRRRNMEYAELDALRNIPNFNLMFLTRNSPMIRSTISGTSLKLHLSSPDNCFELISLVLAEAGCAAGVDKRGCPLSHTGSCYAAKVSKLRFLCPSWWLLSALLDILNLVSEVFNLLYYYKQQFLQNKTKNMISTCMDRKLSWPLLSIHCYILWPKP